MLGLLQLLSRLCGESHTATTVTTRPGSAAAIPDKKVTLTVPGPVVTAAVTGPESGILDLQHKLKNFNLLDIPWQQHSSELVSSMSNSTDAIHATVSYPEQQQQQQPPPLHTGNPPSHICGAAISLYDVDSATGVRSGDPIADQYGVITYTGGGAVMALADGVNWGCRSMMAAKAAVYGVLSHLHHHLAVASGGKSICSSAAFPHLQAAVHHAQQQIIAADGTLTTLVAAVVCPHRRSNKCSVLSVSVGDSAAYVWRAEAAELEEVTYTPPLHGFHRDPRACPGCLGYAVGDSPDLSNITYSISTVEQGDVVFLTSDGISDNFDPVTRKQASARTIGEGSNRSTGVSALSPATCHQMALAEMAAVLKSACRQQQQQQQTQRQSPQQQCKGTNAKSPVTQQQQQQHGGTAAAAAAAAGGKANAATANHHQSVVPPLHPVDGRCLSAEATVGSLLSFVNELTDEQRQVIQNRKVDDLSDEQVADLVSGLPGKMDHASVVAFKVGG